jgi:hypothetical protein
MEQFMPEKRSTFNGKQWKQTPGIEKQPGIHYARM